MTRVVVVVEASTGAFIRTSSTAPVSQRRGVDNRMKNGGVPLLTVCSSLVGFLWGHSTVAQDSLHIMLAARRQPSQSRNSAHESTNLIAGGLLLHLVR